MKRLNQKDHLILIPQQLHEKDHQQPHKILLANWGHMIQLACKQIGFSACSLSRVTSHLWRIRTLSYCSGYS